MSRGIFITFEGLDGSGKSTQLRLLARALHGKGFDVVSTRNPGGTPLGERIRSLLLDSRTENSTGSIAPAAEMALMFADRAQSLAEVIEPALARGSAVLCDRFTDSSEAYQGAGRQLGAERIRAMHRAVCGDAQPDITVLLLPPLETALTRARRRNQRHMHQRGTDENRFERENDAFYARIHAQFERIAARDTHRVLAFQQDDSIERIAAEILSAVLHRIARLDAARGTGAQPAHISEG